MKEKTKKRIIGFSLLLFYFLAVLVIVLIYKAKIDGLYTDYDPVLDPLVLRDMRDGYMTAVVLWVFLDTAVFHTGFVLFRKALSIPRDVYVIYLFTLAFTWVSLILDYILWQNELISAATVNIIFMVWVLIFNIVNLFVIVRTRVVNDKKKQEESKEIEANI